jgi:uncharacterized membrane protein
MPFCTRCGTQVKDSDVFCVRCGARQMPSSQSPPGNEFLAGVSARNAALACYIPIVGWIAAIVVLASSRFQNDREVRFHAFQGLYLFVVWLIVDWVVAPITSVVPFMPVPIGRILKLGVLLAWVFMLVKVAQNQTVRLPILGELAERSVAEQKS